MSKCGCGRSPTGLCVGWHKLTNEEYEEKKKNYKHFHPRAIDGYGE